LRYGHLGHLELSGLHRDQSAATDGLAVLNGEEDAAAMIEDGACGLERE